MRYGFIMMLAMTTGAAQGGPIGTAAREAAEFALKKFGVKVVREGSEALTARIAAAAARHGDDVFEAVKKIGPKALSLADEAGENAPRVLRLLSRHGDDAARVVGHPQAMTLLSRYGDDVAEVLIRHKGIAEPVLASLGEPAVKAMAAVGDQGGRRLAMMAGGGDLAAIGRTPELLGVIGRYGDKAMDFIWKHKAVLAGGTALAAFLANPEPYLDGTNRFAETVAQNAVRPMVQAAGNAAERAVGLVAWTLAILATAAAGGLAWAFRSGALRSPAARHLASTVTERITAAFTQRPRR